MEIFISTGKQTALDQLNKEMGAFNRQKRLYSQLADQEGYLRGIFGHNYVPAFDPPYYSGVNPTGKLVKPAGRGFLSLAKPLKVNRRELNFVPAMASRELVSDDMIDCFIQHSWLLYTMDLQYLEVWLCKLYWRLLRQSGNSTVACEELKKTDGFQTWKQQSTTTEEPGYVIGDDDVWESMYNFENFIALKMVWLFRDAVPLATILACAKARHVEFLALFRPILCGATGADYSSFMRCQVCTYRGKHLNEHYKTDHINFKAASDKRFWFLQKVLEGETPRGSNYVDVARSQLVALETPPHKNGQIFLAEVPTYLMALAPAGHGELSDIMPTHDVFRAVSGITRALDRTKQSKGWLYAVETAEQAAVWGETLVHDARKKQFKQRDLPAKIRWDAKAALKKQVVPAATPTRYSPVVVKSETKHMESSPKRHKRDGSEEAEEKERQDRARDAGSPPPLELDSGSDE